MFVSEWTLSNDTAGSDGGAKLGNRLSLWTKTSECKQLKQTPQDILFYALTILLTPTTSNWFYFINSEWMKCKVKFGRI